MTNTRTKAFFEKHVMKLSEAINQWLMDKPGVRIHGMSMTSEKDGVISALVWYYEA